MITKEAAKSLGQMLIAYAEDKQLECKSIYGNDDWHALDLNSIPNIEPWFYHNKWRVKEEDERSHNFEIGDICRGLINDIGFKYKIIEKHPGHCSVRCLDIDGKETNLIYYNVPYSALEKVGR